MRHGVSETVVLLRVLPDGSVRCANLALSADDVHLCKADREAAWRRLVMPAFAQLFPGPAAARQLSETEQEPA